MLKQGHKNRLYVFFALGIFMMACLPRYAHAEISIAVVDVEKILSDSQAAKSVKGQIEEKRKSFLAEVEATEKALIEKQKALQAKIEGMSKEEVNAVAKEFEETRLAEGKKIQEQKQKLDKAYAEAMGTLTKSVYDVCQTIADERKIDLIITQQNIIVGSKSLDITADVLTALDKKLPSLSLNVK